jgi:hypothetical protein
VRDEILKQISDILGLKYYDWEKDGDERTSGERPKSRLKFTSKIWAISPTRLFLMKQRKTKRKKMLSTDEPMKFAAVWILRKKEKGQSKVLPIVIRHYWK